MAPYFHTLNYRKQITDWNLPRIIIHTLNIVIFKIPIENSYTIFFVNESSLNLRTGNFLVLLKQRSHYPQYMTLWVSEWVSEWVKSLSRVRIFATLWTAARQVPLSMGFSRQEYWSGLPFPSPCMTLYLRLNKPRWHNTLHIMDLDKWLEIRELTFIVIADIFLHVIFNSVLLWKQHTFLISLGIPIWIIQ